MSLDLLLHHARLPRASQLQDIGVASGRIVAAVGDSREVVDLAGSLVTPALVEPHIHLDAC